jgi:ELWxxDGT repeat protein
LDWVEPELWRTDGTPEGTELVSQGDPSASMIVASNRLFIVGRSTLEVIKAGGKIESLRNFQYSNWIAKKVNVNGTLYFTTEQNELWRSNGNTVGTIQLATNHAVTFMAGLGNKLMYGRISPDGSEELWSSDGTSAGTVKIKTIRTGYGIRSRYYPTVVYRNILYFIANDGAHGNELWRSDGTEAGTYMALDFNYNDIIENGTEYDFREFAVFNNLLFLSLRRYNINSAIDQWQIIAYRGTGASANIIADHPPVEKFISTPDKLYMATEVSFYSYDLNVYLPTELYWPNKTLPKLSTMQASYWDRPDFVYADGLLYFSTPYSRSLNVTDGTPCGTRSVDIGVSYPYPIEALGNNLISGGSSYAVGNEPRVYNRSLLPPSDCETIAAQSGEVTVIGIEGDELLNSYPNPFKSDFNFRINGKDNEPVQVSVFTLTGTAVEEQPDLFTNTDYRLGSTWPAGMYILKVNNSGKILTQKMIKK